MNSTNDYTITIITIIVIGVATFLSVRHYIEYKKQPEHVQPVMVTQPNTSVNVKESAAVESYIKTHITTIALDQPVLGGHWTVTSVTTDTITKTAVVTYEDGHIQGKANITYTFDGATVTITKTEKAS